MSSLLLPSAFAEDLPAGTVTNARRLWTSNTPGTSNWNTANKKCDNLSAGGYTDWHLPTTHQLGELYDASKPALKSAGWAMQGTWTSTEEGENTGGHNTMDLDNGKLAYASDGYKLNVTCIH